MYINNTNNFLSFYVKTACLYCIDSRWHYVLFVYKHVCLIMFPYLQYNNLNSTCMYNYARCTYLYSTK